MARQEKTVAEEGHRTETTLEFTDSACSSALQQTHMFTCQVSDRLQFQRLQNCFERGHLQVHLLVDLHVVVLQVGFLVMSSTRQSVCSFGQ